ncbi:MAG: deoxyribodipyrimidine photolyase [Rubripirellula sp.]|nr:deoxyribodipyrimidine photolyase [Rubripirellula sp.]
MIRAIPEDRLQIANDQPVRSDGDYVLYWMVAFRRTRSNFALQHAVNCALELGKPLLVFEPLRIGYRWASDRLHRFVIEGMCANRDDLAKKNVTYFPYVEPKKHAERGLLHQLAGRACTVVTDEYPCFFLPRMINAVQRNLPARLELVDSNGVIPLRWAERTFTVAHSYRRWMQKNILDALMEFPAEDPLAKVKLPVLESVPEAVTRKWPAANLERLLQAGGLKDLAIDHQVVPGRVAGGSEEALKRYDRFLAERLQKYGSDRNHPDYHATTNLSPHLHFGHISAHQLVSGVLDRENWNPEMASPANGKNHGFWNTSDEAEAFLDQVLTWREIGFNMAFRHPDSYDKFESLPEWVQKTLAEHASDERPAIYDLGQFERAETADEIWNAAQREIVQTGLMHNYMRMLWGKKILHWTESPRQALRVMIELNNKYGLDGRDPNSYNGIFWVLGRYDRAWGPKRPVFGSVRYMTSDSTRRKLKLKQYLQRFGAASVGA